MNLIDILACPVCKSDLCLVQDKLQCGNCSETYPVVNGVPIMIPGQVTNYEMQLITRDTYNPWIEQGVMRSLLDNQVVLDAGCGNMKLDDPCVIRMDITLTPYVDLVGDLHRLPFKSESIDFLFSLAVFEHLEQPFLAAQEIHRCLKPGGYVYHECNFVCAYHGYPHHYYNASIHGMKKWFSRFRELSLGVAPYQMPSFAIRSILDTYLDHFKAANLQELIYQYLMEILLKFPMSNYDRKFLPDKSFLLAAGVYFAGMKQDQPEDSIIPAPILNVYRSSSELQQRFPDPYNLIRPDNLMVWARTEGLAYPEIASYFHSIIPFSKYFQPRSTTGRKIRPDAGVIDPSQPSIIEVPNKPGGVRKEVFEFFSGKAHRKIKEMGFWGVVRYLKKMRSS